MAYTKLADMIVPEVFGQYVLNQSLKTNRLVDSGILTPDTDLGAQLTAPGNKITVPFINDLAGSPDNWTEEDINVNNLSSGKQLGIKFYQTKAFGDTELSNLISGAPTQATIAARFANFWNRADQATLLSTLKGVFGVEDVQTAKVLDQTAITPSDSQFSAKGFIAAKGLMGDIANQTLTAIAVNSATESMMESLDLKDKITPDSQITPFGTYKGMTIVVDDDIPIDTSTKDKPTAEAYIFAPGAVRYSQTMVSTQTVSDPLKNGGQEAIVQKRVGAMHVAGTSVKPSFAPAKDSFPTLEELAAPTTWEIVDGIDPRSIGVVKYKFGLDPLFVPTALINAKAKEAEKAAKDTQDTKAAK